MTPQERRDQQIDEVAQLFPYLSVSERYEWWDRLGCPLVELTKYMAESDES